MNRDDQFEKRLSCQPLRELPPGWRDQILSAAEQVDHFRHDSRDARLGIVSILRQQLATLLWPHPCAWAALGVVWGFILSMNLVMRDDPGVVMAQRAGAPVPGAESILKQQERMLAELVGLTGPGQPERAKTFVPRPRSQRRDDFMDA